MTSNPSTLYVSLSTLPLLSAAIAIGLMSCLCGCTAESRLASNLPRSGGLWGITVRSPAFRPGKTIPEKYTADGENISPPLEWTRGPDGTREFLVVVEDPNASSDQPAVHWVVFHLPPTARGLPEGAAQAQ